MSVSPTFGAVGDFISIAITIKDVASALRASGGSAERYQDTVRMLEALEGTVLTISQLPDNIDDAQLDGAETLRGQAAKVASSLTQIL